MKPSGKSPSPKRVRVSAGKVRNSRSYSNIDRDNAGLAYALNIQLSDANHTNTRLKAKVTRLKRELENANEMIVELNGRITTNSSQLDSKLTKLVDALKGEVELRELRSTLLGR
jgi:chromosome segregation ATPase